MARPVRKAERGTQVQSKSVLKGLRQHGGQKSSSSVMRPVRQTSAQAPKVKMTVSAAGILKKGKMAPGGKAKKRSKQRTPEAETLSERDLADYYREGLEEAREAIGAQQDLAFTNVYNDLMQKLANSRSLDEAFFERTSTIATILGAPLGDEQIETTFNKDGKRVTEIVEIGKRMSLFKISVEKDAAKLKELWAQWEELQNDFIELGVEVFGRESFDMHEVDDEVQLKGFMREMKLLEAEHAANLEELMEEIEGLSTKTLQDTKVSERELSAASKKEGARILQVFLAD